MMIYESGYSEHFDGPGTRLIYYLKGCNFRCGWCGAPESISASPEVLNYPDRTVMAGQEISVDEIVRKAESARDFIDGVTFGGGEPTLQAEELLETVRRLHEKGIHTALESNASTDAYREICTAVDYLFSDLKTVHPEIFRKWIHPSTELLEKVMDNLRYAAENKTDFVIRIPVVAGVNDSAEEQEHLTNFCTELSGLRSDGRLDVQLLRQHHLAEPKYKALGRVSAFAETEPPERANLERFAEKLRKNNITVSLFG